MIPRLFEQQKTIQLPNMPQRQLSCGLSTNPGITTTSYYAVETTTTINSSFFDPSEIAHHLKSPVPPTVLQ